MPPRSRRRKWLIILLAFVAVVLLAVALILAWLFWPIPELPTHLYLDDDVNGVVIVRRDTDDRGLDPILERLMTRRLEADQAQTVRRTLDYLIHPRLRIFLKGGEKDVYDTRGLVVVHVKRLSAWLAGAFASALEAAEVEAERSILDVGIYPIDAGAWVSLTERGMLLSNDLDWMVSAVGVHVEQGRDGRPAEKTLAGFAERCRRLGTKHEGQALIRMTPNRRGSVERFLTDVLAEAASDADRPFVAKALRGAFADVEIAEAEVDLLPGSRARIECRLETASPAAARSVERWAKKLAQDFGATASAAGVHIDQIETEGQGETVTITFRLDNTDPLVAAVAEM